MGNVGQAFLVGVGGIRSLCKTFSLRLPFHKKSISPGNLGHLRLGLALGARVRSFKARVSVRG